MRCGSGLSLLVVRGYTVCGHTKLFRTVVRLPGRVLVLPVQHTDWLVQNSRSVAALVPPGPRVGCNAKTIRRLALGTL